MRQLLGVSATARAMKLTPQGLQARIKRGKCPLRPVAIAGKRQFFDKAAVERVAAILNPSTQ